ncbi:MAG: hypothetical protein LN412_00790 [Candidatus Thermoplasmatota archaeon]|nr:hypothetical protein [Candidatus Thermoplasmatota archaeon]
MMVITRMKPMATATFVVALRAFGVVTFTCLLGRVQRIPPSTPGERGSTSQNREEPAVEKGNTHQLGLRCQSSVPRE